MEHLIYCIIFTPLTLAFCFLSFKELVKQLQSGKPRKLLAQGKTISFSCSINPESKKKEVCDTRTNSNTDNLD